MKKKLLYFSQVQWNWIKQRPHFIAEELAKYFEVTVVLRQGYKEQDTENPTTLNLRSFRRLPYERLGVISALNQSLCRMQTRELQEESDIIWLTYPDQVRYLSNASNGKTVVYDCMDDMMEFSASKSVKQRIYNNEKKLYKRADVLYCSSQYLANKLKSRYGDREIIIVNNAIKSSVATTENITSEKVNGIFELYKDKKTATYVGTISEWMDFDLIIKSLNAIPDLVVLLFGPVRTNVPVHERLICCGSVNHDDVFAVMGKSDLLFMPFILNELILSVNPVKLYEYIYSGKPCIAPLYGESEPFKDFVMLYRNVDEFISFTKEILSSKVKTHDIDECRKYALNNTWEKRVELMLTSLNQYVKK